MSLDAFGNIDHHHDHHAHAMSHHHGHQFSDSPSSYAHTLVLPHVPLPGEVFGLRVTGQDSQVGLCCNGYKGPSAQVDKQYALPAEASFCVNLQEVNEFVDKINGILRDTHMPMIPLMLTHFCVPFSPICVLSHYASKRLVQLKALVEEMNTKASVRDSHW
jgi:hypothetical protein